MAKGATIDSEEMILNERVILSLLDKLERKDEEIARLRAIALRLAAEMLEGPFDTASIEAVILEIEEAA